MLSQYLSTCCKTEMSRWNRMSPKSGNFDLQVENYTCIISRINQNKNFKTSFKRSFKNPSFALAAVEKQVTQVSIQGNKLHSK